ncbi:MAG TPA: hypothetical protein VFN09_01560 [Rhodanobacteraceae bacterium]|nr:hypothetical protein [Rhodanobacteraceae bacterium]
MQIPGAALVPAIAAHRLRPLARWQHRQAQPFNRRLRALLWQMRWQPSPPQRGRQWTLLVLVAVLHLLGVLALNRLMQPLPTRRTPTASDFLEVRLLEAPPPAPAEPTVQHAPTLTVRAQARVAHATARPPARPIARESREPAASAARLYDGKGEVLLPAGAISTPPAPPTPAYRSAKLVATPGLLDPPKSPIEYKPTRFEKAWVPPNENLWQEAARKTTVVKKVVKLPGGYSVKCGISPLQLAFGCGIAAPEQLAAPLEVQHERDNFASATPLIKPKPKPAVAASAAVPAHAASVPAPARPASVVAPARAGSVRPASPAR